MSLITNSVLSLPLASFAETVTGSCSTPLMLYAITYPVTFSTPYCADLSFNAFQSRVRVLLFSSYLLEISLSLSASSIQLLATPTRRIRHSTVEFEAIFSISSSSFLFTSTLVRIELPPLILYSISYTGAAFLNSVQSSVRVVAFLSYPRLISSASNSRAGRDSIPSSTVTWNFSPSNLAVTLTPPMFLVSLPLPFSGRVISPVLP